MSRENQMTIKVALKGPNEECGLIGDATFFVTTGKKKVKYEDVLCESNEASAVAEVLLNLAAVGAITLEYADDKTKKWMKQSPKRLGHE